MAKTPQSFPPLKNDLLLRAARGEYTERVPIWLHRQAGRYLPEYLAESKKAGDFFSLCRDPERVRTVTLQPIDRYPLDAAIIFSDILVIPQALGLEVEMRPGVGPHLPKPIVDPSHLSRLRPSNEIDVNKLLGYVFEAITLTRHALNGRVPLIGFAGAPWTIMCYMVEGGGAKSYNKAKAWLYKYPKEARELLQRITDVTVAYLLGQVRAGAQLLEVFDSWSGDLSPVDFNDFALPYLIQIATRVKDTLRSEGAPVVPMTVFPRGSHYCFEALVAAGCYDVVSLDWAIDPKEVRDRIAAATAARVAAGTPTRILSLQGNLEPSALFADEPDLRRVARDMIDRFGTQRYIANLGHGMLPSHSPESVAILIDEVHRYSEHLNRTRPVDATAPATAATTAATRPPVRSLTFGLIGATIATITAVAKLWKK